MKAIERGRGRLLWITWICKALRPWLAPFFQCCSHTCRNGRVRVTMQLHMAASLWKGALTQFKELHQCRSTVSATGKGAADAMAAGSKAAIGGWWTSASGSFHWFQLETSMEDLPRWMHSEIPANRRINFWELTAQVVLVFLRLREMDHANFNVMLRQECDNSASVGVVQKFFTTSAPMCYGLQALAHHCSRACATVQVSHVAGKKNVLADGISRNLPAVMAKLPAGTQVTDFTLRDVFDPVWVFAAQ